MPRSGFDTVSEYDPYHLKGKRPNERLEYLSRQPGYSWLTGFIDRTGAQKPGSGYWDKLVNAMGRGGAAPDVNIERMSIAGNEMGGYSGINEAAQENLDAERMWRQNVDPWEGPTSETFSEEVDRAQRFAGPQKIRDMYLGRSVGFYDENGNRKRRR
jgi:hypothetical protein